MNKKNIIIMSVCLVVMAAAVIGMAVVRFGGSEPAEDTALGENVTVNNNNDVNVSDDSDTEIKDNEDTDVTESGNSDNDIQSGGPGEKVTETVIPMDNGASATLGVVPSEGTSDIDEDDDDQSGTGNTGSNDNTGDAGESGNTGNTQEPDEPEEPDNGGNSGDEGESGTGGVTGVVPGEGTSDIEDEPNPDTSVTYEQYNAMSGDEQQEFIDSFGSVAKFMVWYNEAKAEYEEAHPDIEIGGDTVIDGSQISGQN